MEANIIKDILNYSSNNLEDFTESQRFIFTDIESKVNHFFKKRGLNIILITGLRGTGKTTILKTIAKKYDGLYTSGDFLKTKVVDIPNLTEISKAYDKKIIVIDEVLYLTDWQIKLKIEADTNQNILYIISGSSAMQLKKISQDLSRRLDTYRLNPLSFREYLVLKNNLNLEQEISFSSFLNKDQEKLFLELSSIKQQLPKNLYSLFKSYYEDQLPYLLEESNKKDKIRQLVEKVIYKDMPQIDNLYTEQLKNAEIIIKFLSSAEKINYTSISTNLGVKRDMVVKIIDLLEKSDLLYIVQDVVPTRELRSNKKILFSSPGIRIALNEVNESSIIGFSREDMFGLILKNSGIKFAYNYKQDGYDYLVKTVKFEIGKNKTKNSISKGTIVVGDYLDVEYKNHTLYIPMYLFSLIN
ncbi:MAG TPA: AAA family ATPase [archaeon]|nr:AAA family ATPase [archaeon]